MEDFRALVCESPNRKTIAQNDFGNPRKRWMINKIVILIEERNKLRKIGDHIGEKNK